MVDLAAGTFYSIVAHLASGRELAYEGTGEELDEWLEELSTVEFIVELDVTELDDLSGCWSSPGA
jgi:hypothetical protein